MRYYSVIIQHNFDSQPHHLAGQQAYIPRRGHLMITNVTLKTLEGVAVLIDVPQPDSSEAIEVMMNRIPYIPSTTKTGNLFTDSAVQMIGSMVNIIGQDQSIWTELSIDPLTPDDFMRTMLDTGRLYPDVENQQKDCRQHLHQMFKNKRIISLDMQNDAVSQAQAKQVTRLSKEVRLGCIYVIAAQFPTVNNVIAQEILRRYNRNSGKGVTDLNAQVISDRQPLWELKQIFEKLELSEDDEHGWIIDLDIKSEDSFSLTVFNEFLLPKLMKLSRTIIVIITTNSVQVAHRIKQEGVIIIAP